MAGILGGCSNTYAPKEKPLAIVGDTYIRQEDINKLAYYNKGTTVVASEIHDLLIHAEIKDEWKDEISKVMEDTNKKIEENKTQYEAMIKDEGYASLDEYKEAYVRSGAEQFVVVKHYLKDNESVYNDLAPIKIRYYEFANKEEAQPVLDQMNAGRDLESVLKESDPNKSTIETVMTAKTNVFGENEVVKIYKDQNYNKSTEPIVLEDSGKAYLFEVVTRNKEDILEGLVSICLSDNEFAQGYLRELAKKHDLKLHDEDIYEQFTSDFPYLLTDVPTEEEQKTSGTTKASNQAG